MVTSICIEKNKQIGDHQQMLLSKNSPTYIVDAGEYKCFKLFCFMIEFIFPLSRPQYRPYGIDCFKYS